MPPELRLLHKYLDERFANTVVLTFAEIEDLIGGALPPPARAEPKWWANPDGGSAPSHQSHSWTEANRTATANLVAQTVIFERGAD